MKVLHYVAFVFNHETFENFSDLLRSSQLHKILFKLRMSICFIASAQWNFLGTRAVAKGAARS